MDVAAFVVAIVAGVASVVLCVVTWRMLTHANRSASAAEASADAAKDSAKTSADSVRMAICPDLVFEFVSKPDRDLSETLPELSWGHDVVVRNNGKGPAVLRAACGFDAEYGQPTAGVSLHGIKVATGGAPFLWRNAVGAFQKWPGLPDCDDERTGSVLFSDILGNGYEQGLAWFPKKCCLEMRGVGPTPGQLFQRFLDAALGPMRQGVSAQEMHAEDAGGQAREEGPKEG